MKNITLHETSVRKHAFRKFKTERIDQPTFSNPSSSMKPITIGTAVKTPIWTKNCALSAASNAVLPESLATLEIARSEPEKA